MTADAVLFMTASWIFVLGLTFWSFWRILRVRKPLDPDGIGPAVPQAAPRRVTPPAASG